MKFILPAAVALALTLATAAYAQTASQPRPGDDRGVTINGSGAAVPADTPGRAPPGSYPATTQIASPGETPTRDTARPAAITNPRNTMKTSAAPVPGKNSFTLAQARRRLEANGYSQISGLSKDKDSIWRAQAMKDGRQTSVALDYQGNIIAAP